MRHKALAAPCKSCPYRKDVPSGVWAKQEYDKLPAYDEPMPFQPQALFMCHQQNGCLCSGWLASHGPGNLLAVRIGIRGTGSIDPSVERYTTKVPVFASGTEARAHGIRDIQQPDQKAQKAVARLLRQPVAAKRRLG
jgi:hypothetical protein